MTTDNHFPLQPVINILVGGRSRILDPAAENTLVQSQRIASGISLVREAAVSCLTGASTLYGEDPSGRHKCRLLERVADRTQGGGIHVVELNNWSANERRSSSVKSIHYNSIRSKPGQLLYAAFSDSLSDIENKNLSANLDAYAVAVSDALVIDLDGLENEHLSQDVLRMMALGLLLGRIVVGLRCDGEVLIGKLDASDATRSQLLNGELHTLPLISEFFHPCRAGEIENEIDRILNPLATSQTAVAFNENIRLEDYLIESKVSSSLFTLAGRTHATLTAVALGGTGLINAVRYNPDNSWFGMEIAEALPTSLAERFDMVEPAGIRARFEWSDKLANRYAGRYRDVTWLLYLFSGLAVFAAVAGAIHLWVDDKSYVWAYAELCSIILIIVLVALSRRGGWHSRWLFHRSLAEQLRYSRLAYPFMLSWFHGRVDLSGNLGVDLSQRDPIGWLVHRSFVAAGLPESRSNEHKSNLALPHELLSAYAKVILDGQHKYHARLAHQMHVVAHRMHLATTGMFALTTAAVLLHFVLHEKWLLIFTAALPAFAAALHGIKVQLEFDRLSATSQEMANTLQDTLMAIDSLSSSGLDDCSKWLRLRGLVLGACVKLASAADRWNDVVRHRKVDLPG